MPFSLKYKLHLMLKLESGLEGTVPSWKKPKKAGLPSCPFSSGSSLRTTNKPWGSPSYALEDAQQMTAHGSSLALSLFTNKVLSEHSHDHSFHTIYCSAEWFWQSPHVLQIWGISCYGLSLRRNISGLPFFCVSWHGDGKLLRGFWWGTVSFVLVSGAGLNLFTQVLAFSVCFVPLWPELPREQRTVCFL